MVTLKERLGETFAQYELEGAEAKVFGISCGEMSREDLLAVIGLCGGQIKAQQRANDSTLAMFSAFRLAVR